MPPDQALRLAQKSINNNVISLIEAVFRIRDSKGNLQPYIITEPHKEILRSGLLGDKSALFRVINKGRQGGFSCFTAVEDLTIASLFPWTYQYYVATKEKQSKKWLKKTERIALDSRVWVDGSRIIDIDMIHSSQLEKIIRHFDKETGKKIGESYICGMAASPAGMRGENSITIIFDEFGWMIQRKEQQRQVFEAGKHFVAEGGQITMQSSPSVRTDMFWDFYVNAKKHLARAFYCPIITNAKDLDLSVDLRKQKLEIPYPWRATPESIEKMESARRDDVEYFKQEVLGIPADILRRYIPPELAYAVADSEKQFLPDGLGVFRIALDVAQKRDLSVCTVGQEIDGIIYERWIQESQEKYPEQFENMIKPLIERYQPIEFRIDNTGIGVALGDMIEDEFSYVPLKRIEFASTIQMKDKKIKIPTYLATEFKKALIYRKYHMLDNKKAIQHILRIEKTTTPTGGLRFSGKKWGRDDHFWSKAMLNASFVFGNEGTSFLAIGETVSGRIRHIIKPRKESNSPLVDLQKGEKERYLTF